jgi:hypothetical protein
MGISFFVSNYLRSLTIRYIAFEKGYTYKGKQRDKNSAKWYH